MSRSQCVMDGGRIWTEMVVPYFKILFHHMSRRDEENNRKLKSGHVCFVQQRRPQTLVSPCLRGWSQTKLGTTAAHS
jgi:hypothetical protein